MGTIDLILSYIDFFATEEEKELIRERVGLKTYKVPPINPKVVYDILAKRCKELYHRDNASKLAVVKYIYDTTGWSLLDCKNWFENFIVPSKL